ncbi:MAG: tRNA1(Val) (adenine(37)-N6)-methyltransferase, partial [Anaerotignaceae bacterium]
NDYSPKAIARHEILVTLEDIVKGASRLLKFGGRFYMVHRPHRLADIMCLLRENKLEPKKIRFVHPYVNKEPNMVLVEATRSGKPMVQVLPPLIIYKENGEYNQETLKIYYE